MIQYNQSAITQIILEIFDLYSLLWKTWMIHGCFQLSIKTIKMGRSTMILDQPLLSRSKTYSSNTSKYFNNTNIPNAKLIGLEVKHVDLNKVFWISGIYLPIIQDDTQLWFTSTVTNTLGYSRCSMMPSMTRSTFSF